MRSLLRMELLVNVYGINSQALEAVALFYRSKEKLSGNIQSILISVLTACAHGGLVQEAQKIFDEIPDEKRSVKIWNILVSRRLSERTIDLRFRSTSTVVPVIWMKLMRSFVVSKKIIPAFLFCSFLFSLRVVSIAMPNSLQISTRHYSTRTLLSTKTNVQPSLFSRRMFIRRSAIIDVRRHFARISRERRSANTPA